MRPTCQLPLNWPGKRVRKLEKPAEREEHLSPPRVADCSADGDRSQGSRGDDCQKTVLPQECSRLRRPDFAAFISKAHIRVPVQSPKAASRFDGDNRRGQGNRRYPDTRLSRTQTVSRTAHCESQEFSDIAPKVRIAFGPYGQDVLVCDSECLGSICFDERRIFACHRVKERTCGDLQARTAGRR